MAPRKQFWQRSSRIFKAHVRKRMRSKVADSQYRLAKTGLPPKPYDGSDETVRGLSGEGGSERQ